MKFIATFFLFLSFILNISISLAQETQIVRTDTSYLKITPIIIDSNMKGLFDTVFPNMTFRWVKDRRFMGDGMGNIRVIMNDSVFYLNGSLNIFLFEIAQKTGKERKFSDEQLIKVFIYLSYLREEGSSQFHCKIEKMTISRIDTIFTCYPDRPYYYDDPRFFNQYPRFNYNILVEFSQEKVKSPIWYKNDDWFVNITDHEIVSGCNERLLSNGNTTKPLIWYMETIATMNPANHHGEGVIWNYGPPK